MKTSRLSVLLLAAAAIFGAASSRADGWPANYGGVMLQGFYWDSYTDSQWTTLESQADELSNYFDIIWIPNAAKSSGSPSMGYLPQYWFTNYTSSFGNEAQLRSMVTTFKAKGLNVMGDLVLNHRVGVSDWADFPSETWNGTTYHMDASCVCRTDEWASNGGNPTGANDEGDDFNGGRDLDHTNATVQNHCKAYCKFLLEDLGYAGFRLDMVKGYAGYYTKMYNRYAKPRFCVGEYWDGYDNIAAWIDATEKESAAFDFPFKYALNNAMNGTENMAALCWMANGWDPQPAGMVHYNYRQYAVTFIDNHDTYRNDNKFTGNVEAANAMMLCSPGTPCVFLPHWQNNKAAIKKMIAIRKAVGVTNTSTVNVLRHDASCYMAEVTGTKGKLVVKIGSAMASPSGYSDSQIRASGTDWCIWTDISVDASAAPGPVDSGEYTIYWDNSSAAWTTPKVHYFGGVTSSTWPGVSMTKVSGTNNVYQLTVASGTTGLVFNNGSGTQTDDQAAIPNHLYGLTGDNGAYSGGDTGGGSSGGGSSTTNTVYFDNNNKDWANPYIHYWGGSGSTYPGVKMTYVSGTIWKYVVPSGTTGILFNAGDGDNTKTGNMTFVADHVYNENGDQGSIYPSKIYVVGTLSGNTGTWEPNYGVELTKSGNLHTGVISLKNSGSNAAFSFVQALGTSSSDWSTCNGKHRYGATGSSVTLSPGTEYGIKIYCKGGDVKGSQSWKIAAGTYYVTANFDTNKIRVYEAELSFGRSVMTLNTGESKTINATYAPTNVDGLALTWNSSNTSVATVSTSGKVTAVGKGTATITASLSSLTATCTVYVGKTQQSILWSQELTTMSVGQTINPTATATSGLDVSYVVKTGTSVVKINDNGEIEAKAPGVATIEASQAGDATYGPADPVTKTVTVTLGYEEGDVNGDDAVTTADITATVSHILGETPDGFNALAADVNGDGSINVADVALIVNLVMAQEPLETEDTEAAAECVDLLADGNELLVWWSNMSDYVSGQFDITLPEGVTLLSASVEGSAHTAVTASRGGNTYRVALYSMVNAPMGNTGYVSLRLSSPCNGEVGLRHIKVDAIEGRSVESRSAASGSYHLTGVNDIPADVSSDTLVSIYSVDGVCLYRGPLAGFGRTGCKGILLVSGDGFSYKTLRR